MFRSVSWAFVVVCTGLMPHTVVVVSVSLLWLGIRRKNDLVFICLVFFFLFMRIEI